MFTLDHAVSPEESFEIEKAVSFLVDQYGRSGHNPKPVILHSLRVAMVLLEMRYEKKVIIGAILHDILEDTSVTQEQLQGEFGEEMLSLVMAVSYDRSISDPVARYKDMYDRVVAYGKDAVVIKAVDIAVNSLYIHLVSDASTRTQLVEKATHFLHLTESFSDEPAWKLLRAKVTHVSTTA